MSITYTDDGGGLANDSKLEFTFTFPFIQTEDVKVALNNVVQATTKYAVDTASNPTKITFNNTSVDSNVQESTGAPKTGVTVRVFRQTTVGKISGDDDPKAVYAAGSSIRAADLNANQEQALYALHELQDQPLTDQNIGDGVITSLKIADGTIANVDVSSTAAIAGTKISPDFGSQNIATTGTINSVSTTELAILDGATVSTAELNTLDGVTASTAELNLLDGVTSTTTELNILDGVTASTAEINKLDGATVSTTELNTLDGITASTSELNLNDGQTATPTEVNILDGATLNTSEINKLDGFTGSTTDLNEVVAGKNVVETITGSATDAQIPTAQAVNERVVELVTEVGGFFPIANETSFPTTNPDVNDGAGTIVSIKTLASNLVSNGSGVATISNGAGSGNTVTINGLANSTTYAAGKGLLVETTSTLHTYIFHRELLDTAAVANTQGIITAFNERYYGPFSANQATKPSGANRVNGDLYFNTSDGKMKVFNGSHASGTWDDVAAPGQFFINTLSSSSGSGGGSATFNGTATRFTLSNPPNDAQQLLVSVNGVIQKPNSGTSPSEGFAIDGSDIIFASAPATSAPFFIVTIGSSVNIGTPSDNTVTSSKIVDGTIVNGDISSSAAIAGSKISPDFGSQNITTTGSITGNDLEIDSGTLSVDASNNRVGIGTTSPDYALDVVTASGKASIEIKADGTGANDDAFLRMRTEGTAKDCFIDFGDTADQDVGGIRYNHSSDFMTFTTNASEAIRIDSTGRFMIGTSIEGNANADDLTVAGPTSTGITIRSGTSGSGSLFFSDGSSGGSAEYKGFVQYYHLTDKLGIGSNASTAITIDSSQNVGIGTIDPICKLDVVGTIKASAPVAWHGEQDAAYNVLNGTWTNLKNLGNNPVTTSGWAESTGTFTVPANQAGAYQLSAGAGIDDVQANDYLRIGFSINGATPTVYNENRNVSAANTILSANISQIKNLAVGDTVNVKFYHNEGSTEPTEQNRCWFSGHRIN